jgi:hypothetical protein
MTIKKSGKGYKLYSKKTGKPLSKVTSKKGAMKRERQVQMYKNLAKYKKDHGGKSFLTGKKSKKK